MRVKFIYCLGIISVMAGCSSHIEEAKTMESYDNKQVEIPCKISKYGIEKEYHSNGKLKAEIGYNAKHQRHGATKVYYENGNLESLFCYQNGEPQGGKRYYESGALRMEVEFSNDNTKSFQKYYYENGNLKMERPLTKDGNKSWVINGILKEYNENGELKTATQYIMGEKQVK
ncbi:toxin-antitoxin system YwqK family antitoxin [Helicobacter sp. MIT 11-5569]|uniref:toxin-antitoxin system YwqK family antitoxin n=1 Tax=Helicobacter sp. MIT 11-5569 TaxID=1548151 RepID=UPI000689819D|nr:hypothetical protein [Helicobacter sp. MIT 11-5569]